jgi:catalase
LTASASRKVVHARGAALTAILRRTAPSATRRLASTPAPVVPGEGQADPAFVRFSTVIHGGHSQETLRDPRGFAIKMYTEDGNWDLVGNNLQVFFIRDAMKFPDVVHAFKPDPVTNRQDPNRIFDFVSLSPSAMHMITWLFSPWGIPQDYRHMRGSAYAYKWVNDKGEAVLVIPLDHPAG